jgi:hypothetical protein
MKKYPYNYLGICISNRDPQFRGRVKIFIPSIMPALYENWNKEFADITLECVGDNLAAGLKSEIVERLEKILPWAECASPIIGSSVGGSYSSGSVGGTGQFNQNTNGPDPGTGGMPSRANIITGNTDPSKTIVSATGVNGSGKTTVTYADGTTATLGGPRPIRNNNPGNLEYGQFAISQGAVGSDGRYAVFPTPAIGQQAKINLLKTDTYQDLTIGNAFNRYAPPGENPNYLRDLQNYTGFNLGRNMSSLSDSEFNTLISAVAKIEGYGAPVNIDDPTDPPDTGAIGSVTVPFTSPEGNQTYTAPEDPGTPSVTTQGGGTLSTGVTDPTATGDGRGSVMINRVTPSGTGKGQKTTGTMTLTLPGGGSRTYNFNNGGWFRGAIPSGEYVISGGVRTGQSGMVVDGSGWKFNMSDKYDPGAGGTRTALRIHPDGGAVGTAGCLGIIGDNATQEQFYADLKSILAANGGKYTANIVDGLPGTGQPGATSGGTPVLNQPTSMVHTTTQTQASPVDTTGMAQGMFVYPGVGAMLYVFFREGDPLFPVYFAASYGANEWGSAYQRNGAGAPLYYPADNDDPNKIVNKTVMRFNAAGAIEANGSVSGEQDLRTLTLAHANGAHLQFHPFGSIHYSPNEHFEQVAGNKFSYRLNNEAWTQGIDNKVVLGNSFFKIGNPSEENLNTIEEIQAKIKEVNDIMLED